VNSVFSPARHFATRPALDDQIGFELIEPLAERLADASAQFDDGVPAVLASTTASPSMAVGDQHEGRVARRTHPLDDHRLIVGLLNPANTSRKNTDDPCWRPVTLRERSSSCSAMTLGS
jgi:hypothetical protein